MCKVNFETDCLSTEGKQVDNFTYTILCGQTSRLILLRLTKQQVILNGNFLSDNVK